MEDFDLISVDFKKGFYEIGVKRDSERRAGRIAGVNELRDDDFFKILNFLGRYHSDCVIDYNMGKNIGYNLYPHPKMLNWKLEVNCEIPETPKKILEQMVDMHNRVYYYIIRSEELKGELTELHD